MRAGCFAAGSFASARDEKQEQIASLSGPFQFQACWGYSHAAKTLMLWSEAWVENVGGGVRSFCLFH